MNKSNKSNKSNKTTNYLDIIPAEIVDRIFLFKTAFEIRAELKQAHLFVKILEKEADELNATCEEMIKLCHVTLETQKLRLMFFTNDEAVNNANLIEFNNLDQLQNRVFKEWQSLYNDKRNISKKSIVIEESMEEIDTRFDAVLDMIYD